MKKLLALLIALILVFPCAALSEPFSASTAPGALFPASVQPGSSAGKPFPEFTSYDLDQNPIDNSIFGMADSTVVVIWSDICPSCLPELRHFQELNDEYCPGSSPSVQVMGIACGDKVKISSLLDIYGIDFLHITFSQYAAYVCLSDVLYYNESNCAPIPQTFIVDRSGVITAHVWGGFTSYEELCGFVGAASDGPTLPGDADGSGYVDTTDALIVLRCALGISGSEQDFLALCDMDGNKKIDTTDALMILRIAMGIS